MSGYLYEQIARDKLNMPGADLIVIESLRVERGDGIDAIRIEVGYPPPYAKGPKAGKKNYRKATDCRKLYVTDEQRDAWLAEHPDYCVKCGNSGEVFVRWSVDEGTITSPCGPCDGKPSPVPFPDIEPQPADSNQPSLFGAPS